LNRTGSIDAHRYVVTRGNLAMLDERDFSA